MDKKRINFVVTDLDDTIWDWFIMWYSSFNPYLERISKDFAIDKDILTASFKKLHERYGTTEASFIYHELNCLKEEHLNKMDASKDNERSILHEYYSNKKRNLFLYDGVFETLQNIKEQGALIVGFTESNAFFTKYRLKHLNLDGIFDCIYAPIDTGVPDNVYKHYPEGYWEPQKTEFRYLSKNMKKPDTEILEIILKDFKAEKQNAIYIGDKLDRDISMASQASIISVHALYGSKIDQVEYELLRKVTHWTNEDVERERNLKKGDNNDLQPDFTLKEKFSELHNYFIFYLFDRGNKEDIKNVLEAWKKVIDVQQHFNDIALRIRNYALTLFTAILGGVGLLEKDGVCIFFNGFSLPVSSLVSFVGLFVLYGFWYMDRHWYYRLLIGAVKQGAFIESRYADKFPEMRLTSVIKETSPNRLFNRTIHSKDKYKFFYWPLFVALFMLGGLLLLKQPAKNPTSPKQSGSATNVSLPDTSLSGVQNKKVHKK